MLPFINRQLDPATRLGEILFGLIMALGITGAVRLGIEHVSNRELFVAVLGCNLAWGVVDGVMFAMLALFERGRIARVIKSIVSAPSEEVSLARIGKEFDDRLESLTTLEEREKIYRGILILVQRSKVDPVRLRREDFLGGIAVALLILLATLPVLVPFLVIPNTTLAARLSDLIALTMIFVLGFVWGDAAGASPLRFGLGLTGLGAILVIITIALGG